MVGLSSPSAVKWGQMVSESQASVYQGTGPVPLTGEQHMARLHQVGSVCCRCPGYPEAAASAHGRWQAHLAAECAFPAGSGQATMLWMSLPPSQGQGTLTLPSLNRGRTAESSKQEGPQRPLCLPLQGLCLKCRPSRGNAEGGAPCWEVTGAPRCPRPGPTHLSLRGSTGSTSRLRSTPRPRSGNPQTRQLPQKARLIGALD